ncbi:MAG: putative selenium-dependent hydroxylase accessory protein YqeC [Peptococcaceae bacterium]|jgi:probable selenium-dependent hydroxylase accessory protein YqeC|nr:putative selenium-dependent hydroxylase accessory protein YqeC [Peptococcaceae bacterium]
MNALKMGISDYLDISEGSVAAVVGCGGKTSLIELMASRLKDMKVLISPTTKMFPVNVDGADCLGVFNGESGKLEAFPRQILKDMASRYGVTLLEADGSKGLPAKGWLDHEPVVPRYCTHTVGVVTLKALGSPAASRVVHRLPEFLALTGLREGEPITAEALAAMVCAPGGMFKNSAGRRCLVVNQVEEEMTAQAALCFLRMIQEQYPGRFEKYIYGSVHQDSWKGV